MQVVALAAGGDFGDEFWSAVDVIILVDLGLPPTLGRNEQEAVRLRHVA